MKSKYLYPLLLLLLFFISTLAVSVEIEKEYRGIRYKVNRLTGSVTKIHYPFFGWVSRKRLKHILERRLETQKIARQKMIERLDNVGNKEEEFEDFKKRWEKLKSQDEDYYHLLSIGVK